METKERIEELINHGFKAKYIAAQCGMSESLLSRWRKGLTISSKKEDALKYFLDKYNSILK